MTAAPVVVALARDDAHRFSKQSVDELTLIAGQGVLGDAHCGVTVKHRSRVARDPSQPNLRQVHLIGAELLDEVAAKGLPVAPGQMGENVTLRGLDLLALPRGTVLQLGTGARIELTGLRNPCAQIDAFRPGLLAEMLPRGADGQVIRRAGVMSIVLVGGVVRIRDVVRVVLPAAPHRPLQPV
ncbi:MAG: MOSC domain-containing protein [Rhodobacteraceae bacterium PARR1]|nr:MAG: MOSC domain-containing protein [Rhodobacteraceae bacterium PARR1]